MDRSHSSRPASSTRRRFLHSAALALAGAVALPAITGERSVLAASLAERRAPAIHAAQMGNILQVSQSVDLIAAPLDRTRSTSGKSSRPTSTTSSCTRIPIDLRVQTEAGEVVRVDDNNTSLLVTAARGVTFHNGEKLTAERRQVHHRQHPRSIDRVVAARFLPSGRRSTGLQVLDDTHLRICSPLPRGLADPGLQLRGHHVEGPGHRPGEAESGRLRPVQVRGVGAERPDRRWRRTTTTGTSPAARRSTRSSSSRSPRCRRGSRSFWPATSTWSTTSRCKRSPGCRPQSSVVVNLCRRPSSRSWRT